MPVENASQTRPVKARELDGPGDAWRPVLRPTITHDYLTIQWVLDTLVDNLGALDAGESKSQRGVYAPFRRRRHRPVLEHG